MPASFVTSAAADRLSAIAAMRRSVLHDGAPFAAMEGWLHRSWQRCLAAGRKPSMPVAFDAVPEAAKRRSVDASQALIGAARPVLQGLAQTMQMTRYFAIITDAHGVVVATDGPIDQRDRRALLITRIGVDLGEGSVGTTAIGAALTEGSPVWLHRGEHFHDDTSAYSCAGAPVFDGLGRCAGMLDLTGIDAPERPELRDLVARAAQGISHALLLRAPHVLRLTISWPGVDGGGTAGGIVCVGRDGEITGLNDAARRMLNMTTPGTLAHCGDVFAQRWERFFELREGEAMIVPLWSGLLLNVSARRADDGDADDLRTAEVLPVVTGRSRTEVAAAGVPLRDVEINLIHRAVAAARGNVDAAARALGISRATVYRKLRSKPTDRA